MGHIKLKVELTLEELRAAARMLDAAADALDPAQAEHERRDAQREVELFRESVMAELRAGLPINDALLRTDCIHSDGAVSRTPATHRPSYAAADLLAGVTAETHGDELEGLPPYAPSAPSASDLTTGTGLPLREVATLLGEAVAEAGMPMPDEIANDPAPFLRVVTEAHAAAGGPEGDEWVEESGEIEPAAWSGLTGTPPPPPAPDEAAVGVATAAELDTDAMPWDARIHSSSRARMQATGAWKRMRGIRPAQVEAVEAELRAAGYGSAEAAAPLRAAWVKPIKGESELAQPAPAPQRDPVPPINNGVTLDDTRARLAPPATLAPPAPPAVIVPPPAPTLVPPPPGALLGVAPAANEVRTFPELMGWIRVNKPTQAQLVAACAAAGAQSIPILLTRLDLIPAVVTHLEANRGAA